MLRYLLFGDILILRVVLDSGFGRMCMILCTDQSLCAFCIYWLVYISQHPLVPFFLVVVVVFRPRNYCNMLRAIRFGVFDVIGHGQKILYVIFWYIQYVVFHV